MERSRAFLRHILAGWCGFGAASGLVCFFLEADNGVIDGLSKMLAWLSSVSLSIWERFRIMTKVKTFTVGLPVTDLR